MPEDSFKSEAQETPWEPPLEFDEAPAKKPQELKTDDRPLSNLSLAAAGMAAVNFLLTIVCVGVWMMDADTGLTIISSSNGLWMLLGLVAIGLGAYSQRVQKNEGYKGGTAATVANVALLSGMFIMCAAVMMPLLSAMREMIEPAG